MSNDSSIRLHIEKNPGKVSLTLAEWIINYIGEVLKAQDRFTWALSGGNTPKQLYELLAQSPHRDRISWNRLHIFFGDERYVPFDDPLNNGKMAYDALLQHVPIPAAQIHFIRTDMTSEKSAAEYETLLHTYFDHSDHSFDLALLGMGEDGHTLSLFPGSEVIHENLHWVRSFYAEVKQIHRITLTAPIVNRSSRIAFLATGRQKSFAFKSVLQGIYDPEKFPAQLIKPLNGELHWFIDEAVAELI